MPNIDLKFQFLRINLRRFGNEISEDVFKRFKPSTKNPYPEICVFCNSTSEITKEHVMPRWVFDKNTDGSLVSSVNRQFQPYNKAVVPTCANCNNSLLSHIESYIKKLIQSLEIKDVASNEELSDIIRWLEVLDYKFQVYDCRIRYIKYGDSEYDPFLGTIPVAMFRHFYQMNPFKALSYLRNSQRRITVKSKIHRISSLVVFETDQPHMNFFTLPNEYIFVSLPMYKIAFFYFLRKTFYNNNDAYEEALYIISKVAES